MFRTSIRGPDGRDPSSVSTRPNLAGGGRDEVVEMLGKRDPIYRQIADLVVDGQEQPHNLAEQILAHYRNLSQKPADDTLQLGVVGSGGMARQRLANFAQLPDCRPLALAARNPDTGPGLAAKYDLAYSPDWQDLVANDALNAIAICTNNDSASPAAVSSSE